MEAVLRDQYAKEIESPFTDSLTGLYTHGFFQACLDREISRNQRHGDPFSLALIDVDWFSSYNRRHGSLEGDKALKNVAHEIAHRIREVDLAARYSGDVFAVMFIRCKLAHAEVAAERIRKAIEEHAGKRLTASIGIASYSKELTKDAFLAKAEDTLLQAKMRGKNRVFITEEAEATPEDAPPRVLIVDDEPMNLQLLEALLRPLSVEVVKASNGPDALHLVNKAEVDLVLLDVMMPGMDGFEVCRRLKQNESTRLIPVVLLTGNDSMDARLAGIESGADDFLAKPPNSAELLARTRSLVRVKSLNDKLTSIENVLFSLANTIEAKDSYTEGHVQRVANMAKSLGRMMGLGERDLKALMLGGILHDIGKIKVADSILNKPGALLPDEWEIMKEHSEIGYQICYPLKKSLGSALDVIRYHHEKLDGTGYPFGLKDDEIPMVARIMAVVDIYDALVTDRPYRKGMTLREGLKILNEMVEEGKLDGTVVNCFAEMISRRENDPHSMGLTIV
ncbi:MAG: HD domain-containing phosphohydrolase [Syntrophobacteraceae bacterium]